MQSYVKSSGEQNKLVYFLFQEEITYTKLGIFLSFGNQNTFSFHTLNRNFALPLQSEKEMIELIPFLTWTF